MNPTSFPPVSGEQPRILILGSMPSVRSREEGFYYAHPRNRFWQVIAACFESEVPQTVEEKKRLLFANGIALWDVVACCEIHASDDSSIRNPVGNNIAELVDGSSIQKILCNGQKAYQLYCRLNDLSIPAVSMPSTSPANAVWSLDRLINMWKTELL